MRAHMPCDAARCPAHMPQVRQFRPDYGHVTQVKVLKPSKVWPVGSASKALKGLAVGSLGDVPAAGWRG
jgi:hypothetical protein